MNFLVLSHLRWDFVFQRPQHLLSRCARDNRVVFWEEPVFVSADHVPSLRETESAEGVLVVVPQLPGGISLEENYRTQQQLLDRFLDVNQMREFVAWYYTPLALNFSRHLDPAAIVYDCMDELSAFRGAPPELREAEAELFQRADLVFAGGRTLYEAKRTRHPSAHLFPSSIDRKHFAKALQIQPEPADQSNIPHPRIGYCGVIDERMDLSLLSDVAKARPEWHLVMIGPVVKISHEDLPQSSNIHYLGGKQYSELPQYMAGWDVGMLPFALNESTRFISPTKTPEYLAAGLRAISTPVADVVVPYGELGLVAIASTAQEFIDRVEELLSSETPEQKRRREESVSSFLSQNSWDLTWQRMLALIQDTLADKPSVSEEMYEAEQPAASAD